MQQSPLPPARPLCRPERGLWMRIPEGLKRCVCVRGRMLASGKVKRLRGRAGERAYGAVGNQVRDSRASAGNPEAPPPVNFDGKLAAAGEQ